MPNHHGRRRLAVRAVAVTGCASLLSALAVAGATPGLAAAATSAKPLASAVQHDSSGNGCHLGNGVKHVVELGFDNVHFFRDNPNVPSDLQMMPNLLKFFESNGTFLSNNHTPLIAHTADDLLTTWTGLYGDRAGMPVSNSYQAYNTDGTTDPASSFAYWTDPIFDTASTPNAGHDTNPSMVYSATPPATTSPAPKPDTTTPAPWASFTRAGCDVGDVATVNQELENTSVEHPEGVRRQFSGGTAARRRSRLLQGPRDRRLRGHRGALRPAQRVLRQRHRREVRADQPESYRGP